MVADIYAAVMAGGRWKGDPPAGMSPWRALAPLAGRPVIHYVLAALCTSGRIAETVVVGPPEVTAGWPGIRRLEPADSLTGNVFAACTYAAGRGNVMLVGSDIPLVTPAAIDAFADACDFNRTWLYYPIIERAIVLEKYPQMKRTFVKLRDGTYTGGNLLLANPEFMLDRGPQIRAIYDARKSPLRLARLLGWELMFRTILTAGLGLPLLDVARASALVSRTLAGRVRGVPLDFPEIGVDLDSPEETAAFEEILKRR